MRFKMGIFAANCRVWGPAVLPNGGAVHKQMQEDVCFSPERSEESASSCTALAAEPANTLAPSRKNCLVIGQNA